MATLAQRTEKLKAPLLLKWRAEIERTPPHTDVLVSHGELIFCLNIRFGEGPDASGHQRNRRLEELVLDRDIAANE